MQQIHHTAIRVADIERSTKFYRDILSLDLIGDFILQEPKLNAMFNLRQTARIKIRFFRTKGDGLKTTIEMFEFDKSLKPVIKPGVLQGSYANDYIGSIHICFTVPDVDREYRRLRRKGVMFNAPPATFTLKGFGRIKMAYFKDPDGILLEILEAPQDPTMKRRMEPVGFQK